MEYEFDTKNKSLLETETYKKTSNSMNGVVKSSPTYTEIMRSFAIGDLNVKLQKRFMLKKIDELWINAIEDCLPSLDTIIRNPQFRLQEKEEVLPVEISKHINGRSVIHLSQHTDLINEIKDDGSVVPSKLLNVFQEDTFLTYENKFINTLVNRLYAFIAIRYNGAKECGEDEKNTSITMDQKFEHNEYKGKISLSIEIAQAPKEHEIIKNYIYTSDLWKRVQKLYNVVSEYASSSFILSMGKNFVHLPIMRTNTLLKNPLFKDCLALWEFIESYENTGYETLVQEDLLDVPNKLLEDMYNSIAEQYVVFQSHLNNEIEEQKALDSRIVNISPKIQDELDELDEDEFDYKTLIPDILADEMPLEHPDDDIEYAILVALAADSMMYQEENDEEDVAVIDKSGEIKYRYKYSFYARLIKAQLPTQDYYNEIKNELMSYEDIKCFASWNRELFKQGRKPCAKLNCKGKTLFVYLPLDPKEFDTNKYHHLDVSKEDGKNEYPFLLKVRSNRACKYAKELIALIMERYEIAKREVYEPKDYHMAPMSLDEMLEKDLARLIGENGSFHSVETVEDQEVPEMEAKPAEPEPVEEPVVEEVKPEEPVVSEEGDEGFGWKYKFSFAARLILSGNERQDFYNAVKNNILSYKKVNSKVSWGHELFKLGRIKIAELKVKGKTLCVYLPLDPDKYDKDRLHFQDMRVEGKEVEFPMMMKVKSDRAVKYVAELIADVMANNNIVKNDAYEEKNYKFAYMTIDEMLVSDPVLAKLIEGEVPNIPSKPVETQPEPVEEPVSASVETEEDEEGINFKYKFSFSARLIRAGDDRQDFYNAIKNHALSYKKVNSKISWGHETIKLGRIKIALLKVKGKTLCVYLPLDPDKYDQDRLHFQDLRVEGKEVEFPMMLKVKSDRAVKYACELIDEVMKNNEIPHNDNYEEQDYRLPHMSIEEMLTSDPVLAKLTDGSELPVVPAKPVEVKPEPVAEPEPVVVEAPVEAEEDEEGINFKYKFSFSARLIRAGDDRQDFYNAIKNHALSYKKVASKISWGHDTLKLGRIKIALLKVKGKTLCVYLPLDPSKYDQDRLHFQDLRVEGKEVEFPMMLKVKSDRGVKYACELIDEVMMNNEIPHNDNYVEQDYRLPHMSIEEMLNAEPPLAKLTDNAELPVVEKAPVEVKEEAPVVEEVKPEPVKEPEPVVVEAPAPADEANEDGLGFNSQYKFSFSARLIFAGDETQDFYNTLKNEFLSYKKVASKISWGHELFKLGRIKLAEFKIRGKGIYVYLPLNPDNYEESRFHHKDLRVEGKEVEFPMLMKVKSARAVNYVIELIKDVMSQYEIVKNDAYVPSNYKLESMTIEEMLNAVPALAKLSQGTFVPTSEEKAEEEVAKEETPAPVVEEPTPEPVVDSEPVKEPEPMVEPEPVVEEKPAEPEPVKEPEPVVEPEPVKEEVKPVEPKVEKKAVSPFSLFKRHKNEEKEAPAPAPQPVVEEPKAEEVKVQEQPKVEKVNKGVYSKFLSGILGKNKK